MKVRKMLAPAVALCVVGVGTAQAAPQVRVIQVAQTPRQPAPFWSGKLVTTATSIKVVQATALRSKVYKPSTSQISVLGTPKMPARIQATNFQLEAQKIDTRNSNSALHFSGGCGGPKAKLKLILAPRSGRSPIQVEAECFVGSVVAGKVTLEDGVSGSYQDSTGRHQLQGDIVTLSAFDNAISIVQDGEITLSL